MLRLISLLALCVSAHAQDCPAPLETGGERVVVSWDVPITNADGTPLTDLAGYELFWGCEPGVYEHSYRFSSASNPSQVQVPGMQPGVYYFALVAVNSEDTASAYSNEVIKTVTVEVPGPIENLRVSWSSTVAITDDTSSVGGETTGSSIAWSHTVNTGSDRVLVVQVTARSNASQNPVATVATFGDQSMTEVQGLEGTSSELHASQWILTAPDVETATITVSMNPSAISWLHASAKSYFGVDQTTPQDITAQNDILDGSATISVDMTTVTDGARLVGVLSSTNNDKPSTSDGQSEIASNENDPTGLDDWVIYSDLAVATATTQSFGYQGMAGSADSILMVLALRPASGVATTSLPGRMDPQLANLLRR